VGYSPDIAAAVVMMKQDENGNPVPMYGVGGLASVTGGSFPTRIWGQFVHDALAGIPVSNFVKPTASPTVTETVEPSPSSSETSATPSATVS
jgi:membrane peptidoglycan carboxypeptidase